MVDRHHPSDTPARFEIRVRGPLGPTLREAFPDLTVRRDGSDALLTGTIRDQSALYGVLNQIEALGLQLIEVTRAAPRARPPAGTPELRR